VRLRMSNVNVSIGGLCYESLDSIVCGWKSVRRGVSKTVWWLLRRSKRSNFHTFEADSWQANNWLSVTLQFPLSVEWAAKRAF
jgi:predicted cupin superfamily sugar epimerase